jgi:ATP-dependent Clp protease protease subunit
MTDTGGSATLDDAIYDRLLGQRVVVLAGEVDDPLATRIVGQLLLLAAEDPGTDITLYINSPGGSITAGMAIYDTMHAIEPDVSTVATGMAASMGQFLLTAGAPGKRLALPHADVMMHQPAGGAGGAESDIVIRADMLRRLKRQIAELTARHSGQPVERIVEDFDRDRWFTSQEAVEYGLVDSVVAAR